MAVTPSVGQYAHYDLKHVATLGEIAQAFISVAAFDIPAAWPIAAFIYEHQCKPDDLVSAGLTWLSMTGTLVDGETAVRAAASGVDHETWHGADRAAFDKHTDEYLVQVAADGLVAGVTGVVMVVVGVLLAILMMAMFVVSVILLAFAAIIEVLADSVALSAAAVDAEAMATEFATGAKAALETMDEAVTAVSNGGSALMADTLAANVASQLATGNKDTVHNLIQTSIYGNLDTVAGLLSLGEQEVTGSRIEAKSTTALRYGMSDTAGGETVDGAGEQAAGQDAWDDGGSAWNGVLPGAH